MRSTGHIFPAVGKVLRIAPLQFYWDHIHLVDLSVDFCFKTIYCLGDTSTWSTQIYPCFFDSIYYRMCLFGNTDFVSYMVWHYFVWLYQLQFESLDNCFVTVAVLHVFCLSCGLVLVLSQVNCGLLSLFSSVVVWRWFLSQLGFIPSFCFSCNSVTTLLPDVIWPYWFSISNYIVWFFSFFWRVYL
jgi:hypothetical protein